MPRIKRWFPVSHDINGDPEVWELTTTFGDWLLPVWLEILSITDRAEGELIGTPVALASTFARFQKGNLRREPDEIRRRWKGSTTTQRVEIALYWMCLRKWLIPLVLTDSGQTLPESWPNHARMVAEWSMNGERMVAYSSTNGERKVSEWWPNGDRMVGFILRNYAKYHPSRDAKEIPPRELITPPPSLTSFLVLPKKEKESLKEKESRTTAPDLRPEFALYEQITGSPAPPVAHSQILSLFPKHTENQIRQTYARWCHSTTKDGHKYNPTSPFWLNWLAPSPTRNNHPPTAAIRCSYCPHVSTSQTEDDAHFQQHHIQPT